MKNWMTVTALLFSHLAFAVAFRWASAPEQAPLCEYPAYVNTGFVASR